MKYRVLLLLAFCTLAGAQSVPFGPITQGQVWTPAQWNKAWQAKLDLPNFTGLPYFNAGIGASAANAANIYPLFGCNGSASTYLNGAGGCTTPSSSGTVTTTGSPASGELTEFSGGTSITNGDLSGDCTTIGTLAVTCTKTNGTAFGALATLVPGTGVATFLATPTAANLAAAVTGASLVGGTNVTITGTWPNQTIAATAGGGGVSSFTGDGTLLNNSGSVGAVTATLANTGVGYGVFGNISSSSGAPAYYALSAYPIAAFPTLNQNTTGTAANVTATSNSTLTTLSALSLPYSQLTGEPSSLPASSVTVGTTTVGGGTSAYLLYDNAGTLGETNAPAVSLMNASNLPASALPASGVTSGSYTNVNITVDTTGRVTAASNGSGTIISYGMLENESGTCTVITANESKNISISCTSSTTGEASVSFVTGYSGVPICTFSPNADSGNYTAYGFASSSAVTTYALSAGTLTDNIPVQFICQGT